MMKKKILIVVHTNTWFTEMYRVADFLLRSEAYTPMMHFAYSYPTIDRDIQKLISQNIAYTLYSDTKYLPQNRVFNFYVKSLDLCVRILSARKLKFITRYFSSAVVLLHSISKSIQEIDYFQNLIQETQASLVVMAGDLVGYNTPEVVKAAHLAGRSCVIVPSTMSDGTEQAEAYYFDPQFSCTRWLNRVAGMIWPKWKKFHKGKWMVRLPAEQIMNRQILHLDPPLPWISSSSRADAIAVESLAMKDYYLRCGILSELLRETGSLANDNLAGVAQQKNILKSRLLDELGLDPRKKILLTALPPDFLYMPGGRPECEFKNYQDLKKFWIQSLSQADQFNTVISLHPSVNIEDFRDLENDHVKISSLSIVNLLPLCDVFVASVSSTIRWAITCAKPTINYDVYVYRYTDFNAVKGVVYLDKSQDFVTTINKINSDAAYLSFLQNEIQSEAAQWGSLDGLEGKRMLELFEELIQKREGI